MAMDCNRKNPLTRSGTHQGERYRPALDASYFSVDERSPADLILFAARLSRHLRYYDLGNAPTGDWSRFFETDVAAILAGLNELPVTSFRQFARSLRGYLAAEPGRVEADLREHVKLAFHLPLLLLRDASAHFDRLPLDHPLRGTMQKVMERDAAMPLRQLVQYYKGALALADPPINDQALFQDVPLDLASYNTDFDDLDPRIQLPGVVTGRIDGLPTVSDLALSADFLAGAAPGGWDAFYLATPADTSPYQDSIGAPANQVYHQIYDALNYNLLDTALDRLFEAVERLAIEAGRHLEEALTSFGAHTPHYGLWLAFLRLFQFNQQHLNTLTELHRQHYYRDVLRLCNRRAVPDTVHLLFDLSKGTSEHLLSAATTFFRAGKDATGKEIQYQLDGDIVINRAKVSALSSVLQSRLIQGSEQVLLPYASPVANSRDGLGDALPKDDPQWRPFGPTSGAPPARVGFALADRQLFLREGERSIFLWLQPSAPLPNGALFSGFKAALTGEKGWVEFADWSKVRAGTIWGHLLIVILLDGEDPAVVPFDSDVHGEGFGVAEPVLKVEFAFAEDQDAATQGYTQLRDLQFQASFLQVTAADVRNVWLQNEAGVVDPTKPFLPFGSTPDTDSPLILGSSEVFGKQLENLTLHVEWDRPLTTSGFFLKTGPSSHQARLRHLKKGKWEGAGTSYNVGLFPSSGTSRNISLTGLSALSDSVTQTLENQAYGASSNAGFVRLDLQQGFGHRAYIDRKTLNLINLANDPNWNPNNPPYNFDNSTKLPREPYTPKINEISLSYQTAPRTPARFFHLHPFGFTEESATGGRLFPDLPHEGELYIGVQDLNPPQRLSMLFQTVDGTANPLKGETTLAWHYLRGNEWVALDEQAVADGTGNLTRSGIVAIAVPEDANAEHTRLPAGLHWFRMAATADSDALNSLLGIDAQAAAATFVDQGNDPRRVATPLSAGTISKLKIGDAAVKKISQPHASFGGKPVEDDRTFTVRASERLRHKDRAATMWDYEHLILEHFPNVYKVRCINHTELVRDAANNILADNEVRPGHVLVVPLPYVATGTAVNPLRPYTDKKTIGAIDQFLRRRMSPFIRLEVQNPRFEEVQVKFKVAFLPNIADIAFFKQGLNRAIVRYLSPWAYDEGAEIGFGGRWHKSAIINFVEEQPYVDYVKDFEMYHKTEIALGDDEWTRVDEEVVEATSSRSILVSHPAHIISEIS
jgi:hypothetical protein